MKITASRKPIKWEFQKIKISRKYRIGLIEVGATMEVADGFTVNANLSGNSLGDKRATAGFKVIF